jgi:prepilin-type N-terminal cleavage/methylation domain-containing protein
MNAKRMLRAGRQGFTLTELLVVLLIIGLLATLAVPVYIAKRQQAMITVAQAEVRALAEAEKQCQLIHGYFVPLQMLDDVIPDSTISSTLPVDDLSEEDQNLYVIDPMQSLQDQMTDQLQIRSLDTNMRIYKMINEWAGPFLNPQRVLFAQDVKIDPNTDLDRYRLDVPLDPWGNPYRFYSPLGLVGTNADSTDLTEADSTSDWTDFSDGRLTTTDGERMQGKYAIISYGPNGTTEDIQPTANTDDDDDIIYFFAAQYTESSFRSFF